MEKKMTEKTYLSRLRKIFRDIPEDRKESRDLLLKRLAVAFVQMDECQEHLQKEGVVTEMSQGNYTIMRESPYSKVYDAKYKLMLATVDKLNRMSTGSGVKKDELMRFLEGDEAQ